nr:MAG TPA: hypothetical protein [Caudoviricetes sp.]
MIIEIKYSVGIIVSLTQICFIIFVWRKIRFYRSITQIVICGIQITIQLRKKRKINSPTPKTTANHINLKIQLPHRELFIYKK